MLVWNGKVDLFAGVFRKIPKRAVLKVGKDFIQAGQPIPAGVLSPERIEQFKAQGQIKNVAPDVVADDEPEEIQTAEAEKPKRGRRAGAKPKSEVSDADNGTQG